MLSNTVMVQVPCSGVTSSPPRVTRHHTVPVICSAILHGKVNYRRELEVFDSDFLYVGLSQNGAYRKINTCDGKH